MFELEEVRTWERSPQLLRRHARHQPGRPGALRLRPARRARPPRPLEAAPGPAPDAGGPRQHQGPARHLRQGRPRKPRGTLRFIHEDLPRAFGDLGDLHLLGDLADASTEASASIETYIDVSRDRPRAAQQGLVPPGPRAIRAEVQPRRGIHPRAPNVCWRSRRASCDARRRNSVASRPASTAGDPLAVWRKAKADHPPAGRLVAVAEEQLAELADFIRRERIISLPDGAPVSVRPTPRFYRWTSASMWTPGPFESRPVRAFYYITDVDPCVAARAPGRAPARLQLRRAVVDLDPRGVPRTFPALPAPPAGRVDAAQVDPLFLVGVCRRVGALLRADDGRRGLPQGRHRRPARSAR